MSSCETRELCASVVRVSDIVSKPSASKIVRGSFVSFKSHFAAMVALDDLYFRPSRAIRLSERVGDICAADAASHGDWLIRIRDRPNRQAKAAQTPGHGQFFRLIAGYFQRDRRRQFSRAPVPVAPCAIS